MGRCSRQGERGTVVESESEVAVAQAKDASAAPHHDAAVLVLRLDDVGLGCGDRVERGDCVPLVGRVLHLGTAQEFEHEADAGHVEPRPQVWDVDRHRDPLADALQANNRAVME